MPTLYKFYDCSNMEVKVRSKLSLKDKYPLYAFTINKYDAKVFRETRNMKKFIEIKTKVDKEEYINFSNNSAYEELKYYKLIHYKGYPETGKDFKKQSVSILMTNMEFTTIDAYADDINSLTECEIDWNLINPFLFKNKYIKSFHILEILSFWKLYSDKSEHILNSITDQKIIKYCPDDYSAPNISRDTFNMFIHLYGDTMI